MVTLPSGFTATKYPGYFWNVNEQWLYSIKGGTLKKLKRNNPSKWSKFHGWKISNNGFRRHLDYMALTKLKYEDSVVPVQKDLLMRG